MAFRAPLLGYNTNVRHKGKLYHIQTEDSGVDHPHVITHLFADGGRIVASKKTSYAERVGSEGLPETVKKLMQAQHKAMFISLRDGLYDEDAPHDEAREHTGTRQLPPAAPLAVPKATAELVPPLLQAAVEVVEPRPSVERAPLPPAQAVAAVAEPVLAAPAAPRGSLFGSDLVGDKSLDEVILNYLAANEHEG